jgi:F-type H+-transporting ATPase subunit epsilon
MAEQRQIGGQGASLDVNLVTPRGVVAHQAADGLTAPGEQGEFEVLPGHVPYLTALRPGVLVIGERTRTRYAVSQGYLRIDTTGTVEVLVDEAQPADEVDATAARADLKTAEAELAKWGDKPTDADWQILRHRADWAQARLDAKSAATAH